MTTQRIEYIDLAKGFCIILVVFHHANLALNDIDFALRDAMCAFRMPLYFFLSGLFFKSYEGYTGFLKRKVNKLLIPFLFFHVVSFFVVPLLNKKTLEWHVIWDFLFRQYNGLNGPLWFLLCLFLVNQIFYVTHQIAHCTKYPLWVLMGISFILGGAGYYTGGTPYNIDAMNIGTALTAMPFYCMGYLFNRHTEILRPNKWDAYLVPLAFICISYTIITVDGMSKYFINQYECNIFVTYTAGMSGILFILFISKFLTRLPVVSNFGRFSIIILVTHMPLMQRVMPLVFRLHLPYWWMESILGTIIVLLASIAIIPLCRRFLPYVTAQKDLIPIKTDK